MTEAVSSLTEVDSVLAQPALVTEEAAHGSQQRLRHLRGLALWAEHRAAKAHHQKEAVASAVTDDLVQHVQRLSRQQHISCATLSRPASDSAELASKRTGPDIAYVRVRQPRWEWAHNSGWRQRRQRGGGQRTSVAV